MDSKRKYVLVIGAGGNVSKHTVPGLLEAGHHVAALVRNPDHAAALREAGATVVVTDVTTLEVSDWLRLLRPFDVVVWSAGAGGGDASRTWAVDRDAPLACIDALEHMDNPPRFVMVSYAGAAQNQTEDDGGSWYAYVESKKAVDLRLLESTLDFVILGPTLLTDEPISGIEVIDGTNTPEGSETSRELVAAVIIEVSGRDALPAARVIDFQDGDGSVADIG